MGMIFALVCIVFGVLYLVGTLIGLVVGSIYFLITEFLPLISRLGRYVADQRLLHRALK
jgi:hypothetical protein